MPTYHYVQNQGKLNMQSQKNGQKPQLEQFFLENRFHSNWRSYLVLTQGQKPKKLLEPFLRKISKWLFWANMETFSRISPNQEFFFKNPALWLFCPYSPLTSCEKSQKSLQPLLRKLRYQPTNQPTNYYQQHRSYVYIYIKFVLIIL